MPIYLPGVEPEKCKQRNRLAALKFGVETAPLALARSIQGRPDFVRGQVPGPKEPDEVLTLIHALQPQGAEPLKLEEIYILPIMESSSNRFISDRYMFLGTKTLRNIQREAEMGFSFMNSHHTGALSGAPSELPFGRTYAGRYERYPSEDPNRPAAERTLLGTYMLKGTFPNGPSGPSTDAMYQQITSGILHDVSMGVAGGERICDVCGYELRADECNHYPGTNHNVTREQSSVQKARGVHKGLASYTLDDAHANEVSAVYEGAIPGAGFSKVYSLLHSGATLSPDIIAQLVEAYSHLLGKGDLRMLEHDTEEPSQSLIDKVVSRLTGKSNGVQVAGFSSVREDMEGNRPLEVALNNTQLADPEKELLRAKLAASEERLRSREDAERLRVSGDIALSIVADNRLFEAGLPAATALASILSNTGVPIPETVEYQNNLGQTKRVSPIELMQHVFSEVPQHGLYVDHELKDLPLGSVLLTASITEDDAAIREAKEDAEKLANLGKKNGSLNGKAPH